MIDATNLRKMAEALNVTSHDPVVQLHPDDVLELLDEIDRLCSEVNMLRGEISAYEEEVEDLRRESGLYEMEGQIMAAREDAARLRALLGRAGETLEKRNNHESNAALKDIARTVATEIKEALK